MNEARRVGYQIVDGVATVTMDDGKVNVLSPSMQSELHDALDRAAADGADVIVLRGNDRVFSAGFDLGVMQEGGTAGGEMVVGGFELSRRLLSFPRPVVTVSRGPAVAMGAFVFISGDVGLAAAGRTRWQANEVAIGLTLPRSAVEILRHRLTPSAFVRATVLSQPFAGAEALAAGFADEIVADDQLDDRTNELTTALLALDMAAHQGTKERVKQRLLDALDTAIAADRAELLPAP